MTWHISIQGQVQGVGFRPLVWRAALDRNLKGWVANGMEGVRIKINGTYAQALEFQDYILQNIPPTAAVTTAMLALEDDDTCFDHFAIEESHNDGPAVLHVTPDIALCAQCRHEINDPANRRYRYPFTTCTICGPRYSIMSGLPYDRPLTTMQAFALCHLCEAEYGDPANRRFYAQTNSCQTCGIQLQLFDCTTPLPVDCVEVYDNESIIGKVVECWEKGAIVAIKGTGGFLLTCDATNPAAVAALRVRKHRPAKPFAVMYPDVATLEGDVAVPAAALKALQSAAAPIVLLRLLNAVRSGMDRQGIAPGLHKIGAMLPNAPLFELLLRDFGKPIVATSGNRSHAPVTYSDETALRELSPIADYILTHNRPVLMPQDDSVVAWRRSGTPVVIRRARGLAPALLMEGLHVPPVTALALGAEMKSTFTLAHLGNLSTSQYLGDLGDVDVQQRFRIVRHHLTHLLSATPTVIISDRHPGYFTTQLGQELSAQWQVPCLQVQHHTAHFAAVLAENNLLHEKDRVMGVIWDGTGLGDDGQIWGGEFFTYHSTVPPDMRFRRAAHVAYFPIIAGDKMAREPRLSFLAACNGVAAAQPILKPKFSDTAWQVYQNIYANNPLKTSSVGRLFDAVASLLGLADQVTYEGEAAMLVETTALNYCHQCNDAITDHYWQEQMVEGGSLIHIQDLFSQMIDDLQNGYDPGYIAAKFHLTLVQIIRHIAQQSQVNKIAFSGGVFQNTLLVDCIIQYLAPDFQVYFHRQLSPNDENISFGQWAYALATNQL